MTVTPLLLLWLGVGWGGELSACSVPHSWLYNLLVPLLQRTLRQQLNKQVSSAGDSSAAPVP